MSRTYLYNCFKDEHLCRWPDGAMPINVYLAPFTWYEKNKQQQSVIYRQMVLDALDLWRRASGNLVKFQMVDNLNQSQIDFKWRRVDRKSLGHCTYETDKQYHIFSAEIQIGISDGLLHAQYQDAGEVQHTIIHEIGHALGLIGHSDGPEDIMYVPHQYGIHTISPRDAETLHWLYTLPVGFNYKGVAGKYKLSGNFTINDVIDKIEKRIKGEEDGNTDSAPPQSAPIVDRPARESLIRSTSSLDEQHQILSEMGRFNLKTQNIRIDKRQQDAINREIMERKLKNRIPPPEI
jgi:predicted Zn-dependent protease